MPSTVTYPLDTEGNLPSNLVTETHTVTQINLTMYRIIVPVHAPFYITNFSLVHIGTGGVETPLTEGVDYAFCLPYETASRSLQRQLYGGAAIINPNLSGSYRVVYQCLGDKWSANRDHVLEALAASTYNPRRVYWDQVTNVQELFPPGPHYEDANSLKGLEELITTLDNLTLAIINKPLPTPVMLGLGNIENLPIATDTEVALKSNVRKYVTLDQVLRLIQP
jgi:hypothetical protein